MHKIALRVLMFVLVVMSVCSTSFGQLRVSVSFGPPAIPVYEQPICPGDGYIWTPGYWAWDADDADYYWVPGTWVLAPEVGFLWTPPWWGWDGGVYLFHEGWWGPHVGFYGGINYGFGYFGDGFVGGRWDGGHFFYNRSVANINVVNIHNVYNETVVINNNHVSFNGGPGGINVRASAEQERWAGERHVGAVAAQTQHIQAARGNRELRASVNNGRPTIAATARPGEFREGAVAAREAGGEYHPPANRGAAGGAPERGAPERGAPERGGAMSGGGNPVHPKELPAFEKPAAPNTGNAAQDKKYQQQQDKMYAKQQQDRNKLQQKQEQEHQKMQNATPAQHQQMEQRHQQQTQHLQQQHVQQQQHLQQRQGGGGRPR